MRFRLSASGLRHYMLALFAVAAIVAAGSLFLVPRVSQAAADVTTAQGALGADTSTPTPSATATVEVIVPCDLAGESVDSPDPGIANFLLDVEAISPNDIWAVGFREDSNDGTPLFEHWDGVEWSVVPSPAITSTESSYTAASIRGVSGVASDDVWAVGVLSLFNGPVRNRTLIMHWDGTEWAVVPSPNVEYDTSQYGGNIQSYLSDVVAISANDVWAVGRAEGQADAGPVEAGLALHWDGTEWSIVPIAGAENWLNFIEFTAVEASASNDVWAVGHTRTGPITQHWDGTAWTSVPSPAPPDGFEPKLQGVTVTGPTDAWAVGYYFVSGGNTRTLMQHWNGTGWSLVASPNPYVTTDGRAFANRLYDVSTGLNGVWAVGFTSEVVNGSLMDRTLVVQNGQVVDSPNEGLENSDLFGVDVIGLDVWAVGAYDTRGRAKTVVVHYKPCIFVPEPTITPTSTATPTATSTATATNTATPSPTATSTSTRTPTATNTPTITPTSCPVQFADVPPSGSGSTFYSFVRCLACRGIVSGYPCGSAGEACNGSGDPYFRPGLNVTRGQIAKMVALAANLSGPTGEQIFEDVDPGSTFYDPIQQIGSRGYIGGYPCGRPTEPCEEGDRPYFRPGVNTTRGQLSKIVSQTAQFNELPGAQKFADVPDDSPFFMWINRLANRGVIGGYACGGPGEDCDDQDRPYFRPNENVTRGQTAKIVANTFFPGCQTPARK